MPPNNVFKFRDLLKKIEYKILHSKWIRKLIHRMAAVTYEVQKTELLKGLKSHGCNVNLQLPLIIAQPDKVEIGNYVSMAAFVHIWGGGGVIIGNRVMIGAHTAITSLTHDYSSQSMYATVVDRPVTIEDDVWIGSHVVILPGINIGKGAVIGAGCIVTKDVPPNVVVVGVPGRILKERPTI